jgi:hypothetical protein
MPKKDVLADGSVKQTSAGGDQLLVTVVVGNADGAHQLEIDPCGSGYTPASRDCPVRREPNETGSDF